MNIFILNISFLIYDFRLYRNFKSISKISRRVFNTINVTFPKSEFKIHEMCFYNNLIIHCHNTYNSLTLNIEVPEYFIIDIRDCNTIEKK